jgi:hypothetical protein
MPPVTSFCIITRDRPTLSPFVRARKNVQMDLVSRGNTASTFGKSYARVRSWLSEAPSVLLRSRSFLEREH